MEAVTRRRIADSLPLPIHREHPVVEGRRLQERPRFPAEGAAALVGSQRLMDQHQHQHLLVGRCLGRDSTRSRQNPLGSVVDLLPIP